MGLMRIEIAVDELVLMGFDARDRHRIADALERELAAAITPRDMLGLALGDRSRDFLAPIHVTLHAASRGSKPGTDAIGRSVGVGIVAAFGRSSGSGGRGRP